MRGFTMRPTAVLALILLVAGCNKTAPTTAPPVVQPVPAPSAPKPPPPPPTLMTREECREKLLGKTPEEVIAIIGKPDRTMELTSQLTWFYKGMTRDKLTGKPDNRVQITFEDGKVKSITFSS